MILEELYQIIEDRKENPSESSYVASLIQNGNDRVIQKVGEEATEVIIAAKNKEKQRVVSEVADLWFHMLIMLSVLEITPEEIYKELGKRKKMPHVPRK